MPQIKYTREMLEEAAEQSISYAGVLRVLGLKQAGGTHSSIVRRMKSYEIDTSHFTGQGYLRGGSSSNRKSADEILVRSHLDRRVKVTFLRRSLLEIGRSHECEECGLQQEWNGLPLTLEIDHKDGDWTNNEAENLRFLCPNCHSQQPRPCGGTGYTLE